jgi:uncharacterized damage-inducible protein DinB
MYPALESRADILKMLDDLTRTRKEILERCGKLSAAQLNDPVYAVTWSVARNLGHLAFVEEYMLAWIKKRPEALPREEFPPKPALELPALRTALDEAHAAVIAFLKSNPEAVLKERCQYDTPGEHTVGGVLYHLIAHEIHHDAFILHKLTKLEAGKSG